MQNLYIEVLSISRVLEETPEGNTQLLHEFLFYPEFSSFGNKIERLQKDGKRIAKALANREELDTFSKRALPEEVHQATPCSPAPCVCIGHQLPKAAVQLTSQSHCCSPVMQHKPPHHLPLSTVPLTTLDPW